MITPIHLNLFDYGHFTLVVVFRFETEIDHATVTVLLYTVNILCKRSPKRSVKYKESSMIEQKAF